MLSLAYHRTLCLPRACRILPVLPVLRLSMRRFPEAGWPHNSQKSMPLTPQEALGQGTGVLHLDPQK